MTKTLEIKGVQAFKDSFDDLEAIVKHAKTNPCFTADIDQLLVFQTPVKRTILGWDFLGFGTIYRVPPGPQCCT